MYINYGWISKLKTLLLICCYEPWLMMVFSRCQVWVPGCSGSVQWEEDLQRSVSDSSTGTCQQSAQATCHHCRGCWRGSALNSCTEPVCCVFINIKIWIKKMQLYNKWWRFRKCLKSIIGYKMNTILVHVNYPYRLLQINSNEISLLFMYIKSIEN